MTILVLGGRGKTASRLASLLHNAKVSFLVASRSRLDDCPYPQAQFDWLNEKTYHQPFDALSVVFDHDVGPITAVYLVAPPVLDMVPPMKSFIDYARSKTVQRFVLLSSSAVEPGGPAYGQIHQYLIELGVDYAVLRPSWFMQNFSESHHCVTIRDEGKIYSATDNGRLPWVSADDIAAVAFHTLVDKKSHNTDHLILGPELLSYDDCAKELSEVLGRKVTHVRLTEQELVERLSAAGLPEEYAEFLAGLDTKIAHGSQNMLNDVVKTITGNSPIRFRDFVAQNRQVWSLLKEGKNIPAKHIDTVIEKSEMSDM